MGGVTQEEVAAGTDEGEGRATGDGVSKEGLFLPRPLPLGEENSTFLGDEVRRGEGEVVMVSEDDEDDDWMVVSPVV